MHGLKTNKQYVFRVKSVGRAGNSRYSEASEPILVQAAKCKKSSMLTAGFEFVHNIPSSQISLIRIDMIDE